MKTKELLQKINDKQFVIEQVRDRLNSWVIRLNKKQSELDYIIKEIIGNQLLLLEDMQDFSALTNELKQNQSRSTENEQN